MSHYAVVYAEDGTPIGRVAITRMTVDRNDIIPVHLPAWHSDAPVFLRPREPDRLTLEGYVTARYTDAIQNIGQPEPEQRVINVPD